MNIPQKKYSVFLQVKNNTNLDSAQYSNINTNINSFEFNNRNKELYEYFTPNNKVPMTPKDLYPNQQKQQKGFFLGNFNKVNNPNCNMNNNPNFITNINPNGNMNNNPNFITNINPLNTLNLN